MSAQAANQTQGNRQNQSRDKNQSTSQNQSRQQNQSANQSRGVSQNGQSRNQSQRGQSRRSNPNSQGGAKEPNGSVVRETDIDKLISEANSNEQKSERQTTARTKAPKSVAGSYADDEWSDFDTPPQALTDRQHYQPLPKRKHGRSSRVCDCYPNVSSSGKPSMVYEKLYCKHTQSTGKIHQHAKPFSNNWTQPGELPPIHQTDFVVKRKAQKPKKVSKYTFLMGYPTSMYGYNESSKVAKETADAAAEAATKDAEDDSEYTDDSDADTIEGDTDNEDEEEDGEEDTRGVIKNRRDSYKQKTVKRTVVSSFSSQPRAVVSEYKTFLEEEGYMAGDEVYANYDYMEARMKKGRTLNGKLYNPASGKMEYFDMKTDGRNWNFNKGLVDETK